MKKQINYLAALLFFCMAISGCSKDESYESPLIGASISDVAIDAAGGLKEIKIGKAADLSPLTISSSESWCRGQIDVVSSTILLTVDGSDGFEDRKAIITLKDLKDNKSSLSFNVIQKQKDVVITDKQSYSIPEEGGSITIDIKSNVNYTVEIPSDCNWLTYKAGSRGLSTSSLSFTASKNDSGDKRNADVKLKNADSEVLNTFKITQKFTPRIKLENNEFTVYDNGGVLEIPFTSNVDVIVKTDYSWIKNEGVTKISDGNYSLKLKIDANLDSKESRKGIVHLECANPNWSKYETIIIYQVHALSISPTEIELLEGDTYSLQLTNNTDLSVRWSSSNTSVAKVNSSGVVTGVRKGNATITVTSADGNFSDKVKVIVNDIESYISASTSSGYVIVSDYTGTFAGYVVSSTLNNGSKKDITVNKCTVYEKGSVIGTETNFGIVRAGGSRTVSVRNPLLDITSQSYTFVWEYSYNGKTYNYTSKYR